MAESGRALALEGTEEPSTSDSVLRVIKRFALKSVGWFAIYLLGKKISDFFKALVIVFG